MKILASLAVAASFSAQALDLPKCWPNRSNENYRASPPMYGDNASCRWVHWFCDPTPTYVAALAAASPASVPSSTHPVIADTKPFDVRVTLGRIQAWEQAADRDTVSKLMWLAYVRDPTPAVQACIDAASK